jgi:hypothetical protein
MGIPKVAAKHCWAAVCEIRALYLARFNELTELLSEAACEI